MSDNKSMEKVWIVFTLEGVNISGDRALILSESFTDKQEASEHMEELERLGYSSLMQEMERCKE